MIKLNLVDQIKHNRAAARIDTWMFLSGMEWINPYLPKEDEYNGNYK